MQVAPTIARCGFFPYLLDGTAQIKKWHDVIVNAAIQPR